MVKELKTESSQWQFIYLFIYFLRHIHRHVQQNEFTWAVFLERMAAEIELKPKFPFTD